MEEKIKLYRYVVEMGSDTNKEKMQGCGAGAARSRPFWAGAATKWRLRQTQEDKYNLLCLKKPVDYLISTCHVIVYSDLMFKITNLEFSSSFIHSNLKKIS